MTGRIIITNPKSLLRWIACAATCFAAGVVSLAIESAGGAHVPLVPLVFWAVAAVIAAVPVTSLAVTVAQQDRAMAERQRELIGDIETRLTEEES